MTVQLDTFPGLDPRPSWFDRARCREPAWRDTFHALMGDRFPDPRHQRGQLVSFARWGCATCSVQPNCRAWALAELSISKDRLRGVVGGSTVKDLCQELRDARAG